MPVCVRIYFWRPAIPSIPPTGARIRDRRLQAGVSQTDLATRSGISSSYLNLIEHGRRRIGGRVLNDIARALGLDPADLSTGADRALIDTMTAAAAQAGAAAEAVRAEAMAARYPGWAAIVAAQADRIAVLEDRLAALTDRLVHDPQMDTALHEVLSAATAIRATASILVGSVGLDRDWQSRFHRNLHDDSRRLAVSSQSLARRLDPDATRGAGRQSPPEAVEAVLAAAGHHIVALEGGDAGVGEVARSLPGADGLDPLASALLQDRLAAYRRDAVAMPLADLLPALARCGADPLALADATYRPLTLVLRRMSVLPPGPGLPQIGYAECDAAGGLTALRDVPGMALPRRGQGCPLWPLYRALSRPGQPLRRVVAMPGDAAPRLTCTAFSGPAPGGDSARIVAQMIVVADAPGGAAEPVGRTCRVCPRSACPARREPSQTGPAASPASL